MDGARHSQRRAVVTSRYIEFNPAADAIKTLGRSVAVAVTPNTKTHMKHKSSTLLMAACLVLASCGKNFSCSGSSNFNSSTSSSSSDWTVNGNRTITRTKDGVTRKLETTADVEIQNGQITKFPKGALVKIQETGGSRPRLAELRESDGTLNLWIKDKETFRRASPDEQTWLSQFLSSVDSK